MTSLPRAHRSVGPELRRQIRRGVDLVAVVGGLPACLLLAPAVVSLLPLVLAMCGLVGLCTRAQWTPWAYVIVLFVAHCAALVSFGPLLGTGVIYILMTCLAFMFMSRTWRWIIVIGIAIAPLTIGLLFHHGALDVAPVFHRHDSHAWMRVVLVAVVAMVGIGVIIDFSIRHLSEARLQLEAALQNERESRRARELVEIEIARTERSDLISELAVDVGASIGAALATISLRAESLMRELDDEARACLVDVLAACSTARSTMRSLTLFAPEAAGVDAQCDAAQAARAVPQMVRRTIPRRIALDLSIEDHAWIPLSATDLTRILANLVLNARDAITASGTIGLRVGRVDSSVLIEVTDDGCGMDQDTRARLFQPFFTTKAIGRGTGLGLATAKILVERAGGDIAFTSEEGQGTRITIRLPEVDVKVRAL